MLCSISAAKSGPANWLDRLRSSKGLSTGPENLDLDYYLANSYTTTELTRNSNSSGVADTSETRGDEPMSSILSELFIMDGESHRFSRKKFPRKQTNPKFHSASTTSNGVGENCLEYCALAKTASSLNNSDNHSNNCGDGEDDVDEEEEEGSDGGDRELKGYSRSEVAVIDTSYEVWKFDKLVFRQKSIWKIRDKKGKSWASRTTAKKKGKGNEFEFRNGNVGAKKKAKLFSDHKSQDDRQEEIGPDSSVALSQVPKNRLKFSRSPRKLEKSGSSSVLIRAIPTGKKIGKTPPKNHLKDAY